MIVIKALFIFPIEIVFYDFFIFLFEIIFLVFLDYFEMMISKIIF
jgi:hypothetical protein